MLLGTRSYYIGTHVVCPIQKYRQRLHRHQRCRTATDSVRSANRLGEDVAGYRHFSGRTNYAGACVFCDGDRRGPGTIRWRTP